MRRAAWLAGLGVIATIAAACGTSTNEPIDVPLSELPCQRIDETTGIWESAPFPPAATGECVWFLFEDNATYVFEHPLGRVPIDVDAQIGFNEDGTGSTPPSGNVFLFEAVEETSVTIRNAQNQTFFLRLTLQ